MVMFGGGPRKVTRKAFTAVINVRGEISADKDSSAENIIPLLQQYIHH